MTDFNSWCQTLNIKSTHITEQLLKSQYKKLALRYHPDKKPYGNTEKFKEITTAYSSLLIYIKNTPSSNVTLDSDLINIINELLFKYNINIDKNYANDFSNLFTNIVSKLDFFFMNDYTNTVNKPTYCHKTKFSQDYELPKSESQQNVKKYHPVKSVYQETHNIQVTLKDIYNDSIIDVAIKDTIDVGIKIYQVPAIYETISYKTEGVENNKIITINLELENNTDFEIYDENHLCVTCDISVKEYFCEINKKLRDINNKIITINIKEPHYNCNHYEDGVYYVYEKKGLPIEHKSTKRGDLYIFFNIRKDLENYIK